MRTLTLPANYDVWLTEFKDYLDRHPGSKAELARHWAAVRDIKFSTSQVQVSRLLAAKFTPAADLFLDLAAWLQAQQDGR